MAHSIGCQTARLQKALSDKVNDYNRSFKDKEADTKAVLFRCDLQDNTLLYASDDLIGLTIHDELMKDGDRETAKLLDPNNNTTYCWHVDCTECSHEGHAHANPKEHKHA